MCSPFELLNIVIQVLFYISYERCSNIDFSLGSASTWNYDGASNNITTINLSIGTSVAGGCIIQSQISSDNSNISSSNMFNVSYIAEWTANQLSDLPFFEIQSSLLDGSLLSASVNFKENPIKYQCPYFYGLFLLPNNYLTYYDANATGTGWENYNWRNTSLWILEELSLNYIWLESSIEVSRIAQIERVIAPRLIYIYIKKGCNY